MSNDRSVVASFAEDLKFSNLVTGEPAWVQYYQRLFPNLAASVRISKDGPLQRHGVDRILHWSNGMQITVDEKVRRKAYRDILLELYSDLGRKTPGWTIDDAKICDYVAYAVPKLSRCYFLPYPILRMAFKEHCERWADGSFIDVKNDHHGRRWVTRNIPVSWPELKKALCEQMHRKYAGELALPVPHPVPSESNDRQLSLFFEHGEGANPS